MHTQGVLGSDGNRLGDISVIRIGMVGGRRDKDQDGFSGKQEFSDFKSVFICGRKYQMLT